MTTPLRRSFRGKTHLDLFTRCAMVLTFGYLVARLIAWCIYPAAAEEPEVWKWPAEFCRELYEDSTEREFCISMAVKENGKLSQCSQTNLIRPGTQIIVWAEANPFYGTPRHRRTFKTDRWICTNQILSPDP